MKPEKLASSIDDLIRSATERFSKGIEGFESELYERVITVLKELELDSEGYIKQSASNRSILYRAESVVTDLLPGETLTSLISKSLKRSLPLIQ